MIICPHTSARRMWKGGTGRWVRGRYGCLKEASDTPKAMLTRGSVARGVEEDPQWYRRCEKAMRAPGSSGTACARKGEGPQYSTPTKLGTTPLPC